MSHMADPPGRYPDMPDKSDFNREVAKSAAELVPWFGPFLARVVSGAWASHLEQRQTDWHNMVNDALVSHAERIEGVEEKLQSDEFLTLYMKASQAATETHEAGTREALKNAVINAALEREEEDWSYIFIDLTARLRPAHLQLLAFAANPSSFLTPQQVADLENVISSSIAQVAEKAFPDWSPEYYQEVKGVLEAEGLAQLPGGMMSGRGVLASRTTDKGQRFLDFITEPDERPE